MLRNSLERTIPRVDVLGVKVSAIHMEQALDVIDDWITTGTRQYVCVTGLQGVMESRRDARLQRIHNDAGLVTPNAMPLVWWSKSRGWRHTRRVDGPDLMLACCERSMATGYRHFFYGGGDGVADLLVRKLCRRFAGLAVAGAYTPPDRPLTADEDEEVVRIINESGADIVWVGLGTPQQEYWMAAHLDRLEAPVLIGAGAAFDFHAGVNTQPPLRVHSSRLDWLFRLTGEPYRLIGLVLHELWRSGERAQPITEPATAATRRSSCL
jgi:N-acetylglucosaminyldiphosphoundecaprenol N-acetyl-beta-D-mannosaminyltransferase